MKTQSSSSSSASRSEPSAVSSCISLSITSANTDVAFRYVPWGDVNRRLSQGYAFDIELPMPHAAYSCLMVWICCCGRETP